MALRASARLSRAGVAHAMTLHGGTAHQAPDVLAEFGDALLSAPDARHQGAYHRVDLPRLMAAVDWVVVPSLWWENAPLVIQEAFLHRRPVICADIGGMAEMVRDGVDGLRFAVGDSAELAEAMRRAADEPDLWQRLAQLPVAHLVIETSFCDEEATLAQLSRHLCPSSLAAQPLQQLQQSQAPAQLHITHVKPGEVRTVMAQLRRHGVKAHALRTGDRWQIWFHQGTPLSPTAAAAPAAE